MFRGGLVLFNICHKNIMFCVQSEMSLTGKYQTLCEYLEGAVFLYNWVINVRLQFNRILKLKSCVTPLHVKYYN